jgi:hypothetical protein
MRMVKGLIVLSVLVLATSSTAAANNTSSSFQIENSDINSSVSVNQFGKNVANISSKYYDNSTGSRTFDVKVNGNVSQILDVPAQFTLFNNQSESFPLVANVPLSQEFGHYNGSFEMTAQGNSSFNDSVNVSMEVIDDVKPTIVQAEIGDVQATESKEWVLQSEDNLKVDNISGKVVREVEELQGNETVVVNETVESFQFKNESDGSWTHVFNETSEISDNYYLTVNVFDESGNKETESIGFKVEGLESINVLDSDFKFKDSRPRTSDNPDRVVEKKVFSKRLDRDLGLNLSDFSNLTNKSLTVGIRQESSENIQELYEDGEYSEIEVSEPGSYYLVVFSGDSGFSYDGTLSLSPVPQHVGIDESIEFNGAFVDPTYPELPDDRSLGSFNGSMEFILNDNGVPTGIRYSGEQFDIESCKNADSWSNCIPGFSLGEVPEVKEENQQLESSNSWLRTQRDIAVASALIFILVTLGNGYGKGTMETESKIEKSVIGKEFENREQVEEAL